VGEFSVYSGTGWTDIGGGAQGYVGSIGFAGSQGPAGGYTGSSGYTGSIGYVGSASNALGFTGSQGPAGGYTGSVGNNGSIGYTGSMGFNSTLFISTGLSGTSFNGTTPVTIAIDSSVTTNTGTQTLTNKTITGLVSTSTVNDGGSSAYSIGYKLLPQSATASGNLILTDSGKHVYVSAGITIPPNSTVAFDIGTVISVVNSSSSSITVTQGVGVTVRLSGTTNTGNRTLASYALCSFLKVATDTWYISGSGVS
jgi:hypothetical protein